MNSEIKAIKAGNQLIHQVIYNQAGSIQKALLEYIMNSVDANATKIEINIDQNGINYLIKDNGDGFGDPNYTQEEKKKCIDEVFGYLGFDHGSPDENYRVYGKFGIGRAQLWAFSKNNWHTHNMKMSVDVKHNGLEYEIKETSSFIDGCLIEGSFYEKIKPNEILLIKKELSLMAAFAPIEVIFNGVKINREISSLKSNLSVPNLNIELKQTSTLKIYNQGIYIREYSNSTFGVGGIVCSDIGYPFELNAARNDILQSRCILWKKLKNNLEKYLGTQAKKVRITDEVRKSLLTKIGSGTYEDKENEINFLNKPLIKMINNKYISIDSLIFKNPFTIEKSKGDPKAESIHQEGLFSVLLEEFTDCMSVNSKDFINTLKTIKDKQYSHLKSAIKYKDIELLKEEKNDDKMIIPENKLTKKQKIFLDAINLNGVQSKLAKGQEVRRIFIGKSSLSNAWTDSLTYIVVNEEICSNIDKSVGHSLKLMNIISHEYCHDENNQDLHSFDFYKEYHDSSINNAIEIYKSMISFLNGYTTRLTKNDFVISRKLNRSLSASKMI